MKKPNVYDVILYSKRYNFYGEDWVFVITVDCIDNEIYKLPNIAELRSDGWYKDDFQNTKISKDTTLTEVIAWCKIPKFKEE